MRPHVCVPIYNSPFTIHHSPLINHLTLNKRLGAGITRCGEEIRCAGQFDDLSIEQQRHPLGQSPGLKEIVGHQHRGHGLRLHGLLDQRFATCNLGRIQIGRRLVQQEGTRL